MSIHWHCFPQRDVPSASDKSAIPLLKNPEEFRSYFAAYSVVVDSAAPYRNLRTHVAVPVLYL